MEEEHPVAFRDDSGKITDNAVLFRRIYPDFINWDSVAEGVGPPLPGQGFQDYPELKAREEFGLPGACMSIAVEKLLTEAGYGPEKLIEDYEGYGVASIVAGEMRALQGPKSKDWSQGIMWDPRDGEPWHAVIFCVAGGKKTNGIQSAIARIANWAIEPQRPV